MAHTTLLRDLVEDEQIREELLIILNIQMATASVLAADCDDCPVEIPVVGEEQVAFLKKELTKWMLPWSHSPPLLFREDILAVSQAHIARTVCRRTERTILKLAQDVNIQEDIIRFYNRLSDYFFVLSRKIAQLSGLRQEPWKPGL